MALNGMKLLRKISSGECGRPSSPGGVLKHSATCIRMSKFLSHAVGVDDSPARLLNTRNFVALAEPEEFLASNRGIHLTTGPRRAQETRCIPGNDIKRGGGEKRHL
eukprot:9094696-Pyramimonas_sp.AAC.1